MNCSSCEHELRPGDRFCGRCGTPVVKLIEGSSSRAERGPAEEDRKGRSREISNSPDLVEKAGAIGAAIAEEILPGSEVAKEVGMTLGRRIAEKVVRSPLISFGTDPASAALAAARTKAERKKTKKRKKLKKVP